MTYFGTKKSNLTDRFEKLDKPLQDYLRDVDDDLKSLYHIANPFLQFGTGTSYSVLTYVTQTNLSTYKWSPTIGSWNITGTLLYGGSGATYMGLQPGTGIWMGDAAFGSAIFSVDPNGVLKAHSGDVGGWSLGSDRMYGGSDTNYIGLFAGTGIHMGHQAFASAPFSVTKAGVLKAESGTVGGWSLTATILSSTNIIIDSGNEFIRTANYVSGVLGTGWNIGAATAEFQNIKLRGKASSLTFENETISVAGGNLLVMPGDILDADMTADDDVVPELLIHFDGDDGATAYTAETGQTVTFVGTAQLDTAQKKFGTASLLLDGNSDYAQLPANADWDFGTGDFTIDFLVRFNNVNSANLIGTGYTDGFLLQWYLNNLRVWCAGSNYDFAWVPSTDTWYHVALTRSSGTLRAFIDGTQIGSNQSSTDDINNDKVLRLGNDIDNVTDYLDGWIDEVRIVKGKAMWTENFTPPTAAYSLGADMTISGDTTFAVGDMLRIKDGVDDEWFEVTDITNAPTYGVARDKNEDYAVDSNPAWTKGTAVVSYGASGQGGIFMESAGPYIDVLAHAGSPWDTTTTKVRIGNLNGFLGYATDLYGIAIGETTKYLKYDSTNGLQVKGNILATTGTLTSLSIDGSLVIRTDGLIRSGQTGFNIGTGFWLGDDSGTPKFSIGNSSTGATLTWDGATLETGSMTAISVINVGSAGYVKIVGEGEAFRVYDTASNLRVELGKLSA